MSDQLSINSSVCRVGLEQRAAQQRRMVGKWDRNELEDKYLRLSEENIILKKHARKQEDKIKRYNSKKLSTQVDCTIVCQVTVR